MKEFEQKWRSERAYLPVGPSTLPHRGGCGGARLPFSTMAWRAPSFSTGYATAPVTPPPVSTTLSGTYRSS